MEEPGPYLFDPPSSLVPWSRFSNLNLSSLQHSRTIVRTFLLDSSQICCIVTVNRWISKLSPGFRIEKRNGMIPNDTPATHFTFPHIPYIALLQFHFKATKEWRPLPFMTHLTCNRSLRMHTNMNLTILCMSNHSISHTPFYWTNLYTNMGWIKASFPSHQMLILPYRILPGGDEFDSVFGPSVLEFTP